MIKKFLTLIFIIVISFLHINTVNAISCADIDEKVENYEIYKDELSNMDCEDPSSEADVAKCNELKLKKNLIVTQLMKIDDENNLCSSNSALVKNIIKENESNCGKVIDDSLTDLVDIIMKIFYIIAPILLIVLGTIDYTRATLISDEEALRKANKRFLKRLISTILLFLSPVIVNLIISFNISDYYLSGDAYSCDFNYLIYTKQYNIKYTPKKSNNSKSGNYSTILDAAQTIHDAQKDWTYSLSFPPLTSGNIEKAINNSDKATCCATYVSSVLYKAGLFTEDEINAIGYNSSTEVSKLLQEKGWQKIDNYSDLQEGDIVFMTSSSHPNSVGHVQIYAGNGTWYNAGSKSRIQGDAPYSSDASSRFLYAMRK